MNKFNSVDNRLLWKLISISAVLISVAFFLYAAQRSFNDIPVIDYTIVTITAAVVSCLLVVTGVILLASIWRVIYLQYDPCLSFLHAQVIVSISQLGKYLPGNVGQHVGRVALAKNYGFKLTPTMVSMFIEMVFGVAVAALLGALSLYFLVSDHYILFEINFFQLLFLSALIFLLPWIAIYLANCFFPQLIQKLSGQNSLRVPSLATAFIVAFLFTVCFVLFGVILKIHSLYFFHVDVGSVIQFTCLFALAWVVGYIVPGAPGGLGVRESAMIILMSPLVGEGTAVALSISLRITTTVGDAVAFLYGIIIRRYLLDRHL